MTPTLGSRKKYTPLFWLLLAVVLFQVVFCGWFVYRGFYLMMDSDMASGLLVSEQIAREGGWLFSENWYGGTELHVFCAEFIMVPLFHLPLSYREISALLALILVGILAAASYGTLRLWDCSPEMSMLGALLLIFPYTSFSYHTLIAPGYTFSLALGVLACGLMRRDQLKPLRLPGLCALMVLGFMLGVSGMKQTLLELLPIGCFPLMCWAWQSRHEYLSLKLIRRGVTDLWRPLLFLVVGLLGYGLYQLVLVPRFGESIFNPGISDPAGIGRFLTGLPRMLLEYAGLGESERNMALGVLSRGTALLFTATLYLGFYAYWKAEGDPRSRLLSRYTLFSFIFTFVALINLGNGDSVIIEYRYLGLSWFMLFLLLPLMLDKLNRRSLAFIAAVLICLSTFAVRTYQAQSNARQIAEGDRQRSDAILYLCDEGYNYGLATFWHGAVNTVRTDGQLRFQPVFYYEDRIVQREWFCPKDYRLREPEFFLFAMEEWEECQNAQWEMPGEVVYDDGAFVIVDVRGDYDSYKAVLADR